MRSRRAVHLVLGSAALVLAAGCGSTGSGTSTSDELHMAPGMQMAPGSHMSTGMQMSHSAQVVAGAPGSPSPSETARMVCGDEIHGDVAQTFGLSSLAAGVSTWSDRLFTCTYILPTGPLTVSVKDSPSEASGQAYFNALHAFDGAQPLLKGLQAFGLPSYETASGRVVFLKDGKTLVVDAGALPKVAGPTGESRTDVAYAVAADVVGCWSE